MSAPHDPRATKQSRVRQTVVCLRCRTLKRRCDRQSPCSTCKAANVEHACSYGQRSHTSVFSSLALHTSEGRAGQPDSSRSPASHDFRNDTSEALAYHGRSAGLDIPTLIDTIRGGHGAMLDPSRPADEQAFDLVRHTMLLNFVTHAQRPADAERDRQSWNTLLSSLPDLASAKELFAVFVEQVDPLHHAWHIPTTRDSFLAFFEMSRDTRSTVPASTLAFYLAILAAGHVFSPGLTSTQGLYLDCVQEALRIGNCVARPDAKSLQAQIIYGVCLFSLRRAEEHWSLLGSLLRQAQSVGLHKLAEPQSSADTVRIEIGKRIWWTIYLHDMMMSIHFGRPCAINSFTTSLPANVADDQISTPGATSSDTSFACHRCFYNMATHMRLVANHVDAYDDRRYHSSYLCELQTIDATLREWEQNLPDYLRFDPDRVYKLDDRTLTNRQQTISLAVLYHSTRIVLRRPHLSDEVVTTEISEHAAVTKQAAHALIIASHQLVLHSPAIWSRRWIVVQRTVHAGLLCGFLVIRYPAGDVLATSMRDLRLAIDTFELARSHFPDDELVLESIVLLQRTEWLALDANRSPDSPSPTSAQRLLFQASSAQGQGGAAEQEAADLGWAGDWPQIEDGDWLSNVLREWSTFEANEFEM